MDTNSIIPLLILLAVVIFAIVLFLDGCGLLKRSPDTIYEVDNRVHEYDPGTWGATGDTPDMAFKEGFKEIKRKVSSWG